MTEERGDEVAAATAMRLGDVTTETIRATGGRIVKLLGDGVLVRFADATAARRWSARPCSMPSRQPVSRRRTPGWPPVP